MQVKDLMTREPLTTRSKDTLVNALEIMKQEDTGIVPVVDDNELLVGVVTDRDIALYLADHPSKPVEKLTVKELLGGLEQLVTISPEDSLEQAIRLMEENQLRRLPVRDTQMKCVGILSQADIARSEGGLGQTGELVNKISQEKQQTVGSNP